MMQQSLVDITITVYNHSKYLRQTLDGVLAQKTTFPYRMIIGDDCSTDGSTEIIKEYENRFPDKIMAIYQNKNLGLKGPVRNGIILRNTATAKYVALLEGDDYWTDPLKLQKQIDFLEVNPDHTLCFHNAIVEYENGAPSHPYLAKEYLAQVSEKFPSIEDLFKRNFAPTASCVYRNSIKFTKDFYKSPFGDWALLFLLADSGKFKYINEVMSVYRVHSNGAWNSLPYEDRWIKAIKTLEVSNRLLKGKYKSNFYRGMIPYYIELCRLYQNKGNLKSYLYPIRLLRVWKYDKKRISKKEIINFLLHKKSA